MRRAVDVDLASGPIFFFGSGPIVIIDSTLLSRRPSQPKDDASNAKRTHP